MPHLKISNILYRLNGSRSISPICAQELGTNHRNIPIHPRHPSAISPRRTDGASDVGTMGINSTIIDTIIVIEEIPTAAIIDIAITVIVNAVDGIKWVDPNVVFQVGMGNINAGINDAHKHRFVARKTTIPSRFGLTAKDVGGTGWPYRGGIIGAVHSPQGA